jgi:hypothetical protein
MNCYIFFQWDSLRNYTDLPRIFNVCVSFRDQDKKAKNVILGGKRCILIGTFDPPKKHEGHSPYIAIKLILSAQGGWKDRSDIEGARDELREGVNKKTGKVWPFTKPPSDPGLVLFLEKIGPHFLLENTSVIAETNFTFWGHD